MTTIGPAALLQAQSAYNTTSTPSANTNAAVSVENAADFQQMVAKNVQSFTKMDPAQILSMMNQARAVTGLQNTQINTVSGAVGSLASSIKNSEEVTKRSIIGEATLSEVISATSEAKTALQSTVAVRNKLFDMWKEISNMQI